MTIAGDAVMTFLRFRVAQQLKVVLISVSILSGWAAAQEQIYDGLLSNIYVNPAPPRITTFEASIGPQPTILPDRSQALKNILERIRTILKASNSLNGLVFRRLTIRPILI